MSENKSGPIETFRDGRIAVSVWPSGNNFFKYHFKPENRYKDPRDGVWKPKSNYNRSELLKLAEQIHIATSKYTEDI